MYQNHTYQKIFNLSKEQEYHCILLCIAVLYIIVQNGKKLKYCSTLEKNEEDKYNTDNKHAVFRSFLRKDMGNQSKMQGRNTPEREGLICCSFFNIVIFILNLCLYANNHAKAESMLQCCQTPYKNFAMKKTVLSRLGVGRRDIVIIIFVIYELCQCHNLALTEEYGRR